jgi:hypothetical protein
MTKGRAEALRDVRRAFGTACPTASPTTRVTLPEPCDELLTYFIGEPM